LNNYPQIEVCKHLETKQLETDRAEKMKKYLGILSLKVVFSQKLITKWQNEEDKVAGFDNFVNYW